MAHDRVIRELTGSVVYLERIALPPNAEISVVLVDTEERVLARQMQVLGERQVPVPFRLDYPADEPEADSAYALRAEIRVDGRVAFRSSEAVPVPALGDAVELRVRTVSSTES